MNTLTMTLQPFPLKKGKEGEKRRGKIFPILGKGGDLFFIFFLNNYGLRGKGGEYGPSFCGSSGRKKKKKKKITTKYFP